MPVAIIATAFHFSKPLPDIKTDESFLPKAEYVKTLSLGQNSAVAGLFWIQGLTALGNSYLFGEEYDYLGHIGNLSTSLDSLFYTPYYFIGGITPIQAKDTSDYAVMRRAIKTYPDDWRLALYFAIRLANGPYKQYKEAADVMKYYANVSDSTIPAYVKTIYKTFELNTMQTEIALTTIIEDATNPVFANFKESLQKRAKRILGYSLAKETESAKEIDFIISQVIEKKLDPNIAYKRLLSLKTENK